MKQFQFLKTGIVVVILITGASPSRAENETVQQPKQLDTEVTIRVRMDYLLHLPPEYGDDDKAWPLILFLHGMGESGVDLEKVKVHGPPKLLEAKQKLPFIVVSPQSLGMGWNPHELNALLDDVVSKYRVDEDRVYLTGLSMGGTGSWLFAATYPERFAAVVPICAEGYSVVVPRLRHLPIWVFHGAKDDVVSVKYSERMVKELNQVGANVKFTVYPDATHDSWTETYNNPQLFEWLLQQKRSDR